VQVTFITENCSRMQHESGVQDSSTPCLTRIRGYVCFFLGLTSVSAQLWITARSCRTDVDLRFIHTAYDVVRRRCGGSSATPYDVVHVNCMLMPRSAFETLYCNEY
jgi:hypothetical protein